MLIAQRPTLTEEKIAEFRSRFVIEPLEPGFGYTIGNALRRSLLSSIPGAAVTSIRIDGVLHEFSTIPGVKEDVTEIILNIKQLVVSSERDEPITCRGKDLSMTGIGLYLPEELSTSEVLVELPNPLRPPTIAVPATLVRAKRCADGWYEVGAIFHLVALRRSHAELCL